jgi:hypothetical protein
MSLDLHSRILLSKIKTPTPDYEWVAQVSLLRPGFLLVNEFRPNTHSTFVRAILVSPLYRKRKVTAELSFS